MMTLPVILVAALVGTVRASRHMAVRRQVSELRDSYDFVIAGGGTSGLTVADRLSEAFSDSKLDWPSELSLTQYSQIVGLIPSQRRFSSSNMAR